VDFFLDSAWVIAALPLIIAAVIAMFARSLGEKSWILGSAGMFVAFIWSVGVLFAMIQHAAGHGDHQAGQGPAFFMEPAWHIQFDWAIIGEITFPMGLMVDNLTAIMLVVVTLVSFCVQVYSSAYMHDDKRFTRFYAAINLFTVGMLGLVLADNLFLLLVSWEIMGLCSYLLIGHWYEQEWPRMGQIKAFLTTRVGDVGMMFGIFLLFALAGTLTWSGLAQQIPVLMQTPGNAALVGLAGLLIFTGAMGKSAQFPLHTWLPDAMAGPTPGSALIHAATMVAAGVYLIGRTFMVFGNAPEWVLIFVAFIGAFTAIFAASIATLRHDIKEVLAYSTISQLGYMVMAIGLGGWAAGNFHLMTHAFFKALLFLGAGSIIHAHHHNQLMHKMGGLRKKIPITYVTWMIGYLALVGFPGFSGFFSKDELLIAAWTWHPVAFDGLPWLAKAPFVMAITTAFLTAYYMTRATYLVFFGKPREQELYDHAHESPKAMTIPLMILAVPAALSGWLWAAVPAHLLHWDGLLFLADFLHLPGVDHTVEFSTELLVTGMATTAGFLGIGLGWYLYAKVSPKTRKGWIQAGLPIYNLVRGKYFIDEFYGWTAVKGSVAASKAISWFDGAVVDGVVNSVGTFGVWLADASAWFDTNVIDRLVTIWADIARSLAAQLRRISTGQVQQYMATVVVVLIVSMVLFQVFR